ncbi:MAG: hypothetical protein M3257_00065 [Actinomycetota bacterium]|nr:hypothetical protein [Actinomycetota bacterium]
MPQRNRLDEVADRVALVGLAGVSVWGVVGIVAGCVWAWGSQPDWSVFGAVYLIIFWFFAALGVIGRYWLGRYEFHRQERGPFIIGGHYQVVVHGLLLPLLTVVALIRNVDGAPLWLIVLGCVPVIIALAAEVDSHFVLRGAKRGMHQ